MVALFQRLGLSRARAFLLAILGLVAFADVIFASLPESFPLTSTAMVLMLWLGLNPPEVPARFRSAAWLVTEIFAIGTTITNISWTWAARLVQRPWPEAMSLRAWVIEAVRAVVLLIAVIAVTFGLQEVHGYNALFRAKYHSDVAYLDAHGKPRQNMFKRFTFLSPSHLAAEAVAVPQTMLRSLYTPAVGIMPKEDPSLIATDMQTRFTLNDVRLSADELAVDAVLLVLLIAGTIHGWHTHRQMIAFAASVVLFNFCLHLAFGREPFLYAEHWLPALLLFIAPLLAQRARFARVGTLAVGLLIVVFAVQDVRLLTTMLSQQL
jgi:hypothetical protein